MGSTPFTWMSKKKNSQSQSIPQVEHKSAKWNYEYQGKCTQGCISGITSHLLQWVLNSAHKHVLKIISLIYQWSDINFEGPLYASLYINILIPFYYVTQSLYEPLLFLFYNWRHRRIRGVELPAWSHGWWSEWS